MIGVKDKNISGPGQTQLSFDQSSYAHRYRGASHSLERYITAREIGYWMHAIGVTASKFGRLPPGLQIARRFQQSAPQCDNSGVACAQVLLGPIHHWPVQVLLNRYVFLADAAHTGEVFVLLLLAINKIVVRTVGDRLERTGIDLG